MLPNLDIRTWIALATSAALIVVVLSVPWARKWLAEGLVGLGVLLGGAAENERRARQQSSSDDPPTDDNPTGVTSDDYERDPVPPSNHEGPTPRGGDGSADRDYWRDAHDRGTDDE